MALWPPTGLALAFTLLGSRYCSLASGLGVMASFLASPQLLDSTSSELVFEVSAYRGLVTGLQAALGAWLIQRTVGVVIPRFHIHRILPFLLLAGPIHTLASPLLLGTWFGLNDTGAYTNTISKIASVWQAEATSGIILTPILLLFRVQHDGFHKLRSRKLIWPALGLGALLVVAQQWGSKQDAIQAREAAQQEANHAAFLFRQELKEISTGVREIQFYEDEPGIKNRVSPYKEIDADLRILRKTCPMIESLAFARLLTQQDRQQFESGLRRFATLSQFQILDLLLDREFVRAESRPRHLAITARDPTRAGGPPVGFDLMSILGVRDAFDTGVSEGRSVILNSYPAFLRDQADSKRLILLTPMYVADPPTSLQERLEQVCGALLAVLDVSQAESVFAERPNSQIRFEISGPADSGAFALRQRGEFEVSSSIAGTDHSWRLHAIASPEFVNLNRTHYARIISIAGVVVILAILILLFSVSGQNLAVASEVEHRTAELNAAFDTQKLTEAALRWSEGRLAEAQRIAKVGYWEWDPISSDAFWSERVYEVLGIDPLKAEVSAEEFIASVHAEDRESFISTVWLVLSQRERREIELRIQRLDGGERWIECSLACSIEEPVYMQGTLQDVTSRKRAELESKAALERLNEAQRIAKMGSFEWVSGQHRPIWSNQMYRLLGYEPGSIDTSLESFLNRVHSEDRQMIAERIEDTLQNDAPFAFDFRIIHSSGEIRSLHVDAVLERDAQGYPIRWRGTNIDITENVRVEAERRLISERLSESQRLESLGVLASGVAHDFNNLMAGVLGNATLLRELIPSDSELQDFLIPIENSAIHAGSLCQQMLAYSGKGVTERGAVDLNSVIRASSHLIKLAVGNQVTVNRALDDTLPLVEADESQIRQLLLNLVTNAMEAMSGETQELQIQTGSCDYGPCCKELGIGHRCQDLPPVRYVWFEVSDNGSGMDPETMARMFDPFYSTKFTGRGLGLSAVHGITRSHGGAVCVTSNIGEGTTFRIYLTALADQHSTRTLIPDRISTAGLQFKENSRNSTAS